MTSELDKIKQRLLKKGIKLPDIKDMREWGKRRAETMNRVQGQLKDGVHCAVCKDRGVIYQSDDDGYLTAHECACMAARRGKRRMINSGLGELMERYTFATWQEREPWQKEVASTARRYLVGKEGWLLAYGQSGAGKTHICTAVCNALLNSNMPVRYMLWRELAVKAKSLVNSPDEYAELLNPLKRVPVLYLDDFYKTGKNQDPTTGDVNLAFELINARYNDKTKMTLISTERTLEEIMEIDEAVGSRIYERSKGFRLNFRGKRNWRLSQ